MSEDGIVDAEDLSVGPVVGSSVPGAGGARWVVVGLGVVLLTVGLDVGLAVALVVGLSV